jgi:hypothetical protein
VDPQYSIVWLSCTMLKKIYRIETTVNLQSILMSIAIGNSRVVDAVKGTTW